jgi:virginiamycin B lyase
MPPRHLVALVAVTLGVALAAAPAASADLFWTNIGDGTIGHSALDGMGVNQSFLQVDSPGDVRVVGDHIYWADATDGTIGRANLDGSGVDATFIQNAGVVQAIAVDDAHVYWTNDDEDTDAGPTIGRANLDGSGAKRGFIPGPAGPQGIAVDGDHIYWANGLGDSIARADLDGSHVDESFIDGPPNPTGLAVDGAHIYWANADLGDGTTIGRADIDGTHVDEAFIDGASSPLGLAVDGDHIYWANFGTDAIGRAGIDGSNADQEFITGASSPAGVSVASAAGGVSGGLSLTKLKVSHSSFVAATSGKSTSDTASKKSTKVSYTLSAAATVRFTVLQRKAGRTVSGKCRKRTSKNAARKKCDLALKGSFTVDGTAGTNSFYFRGRLRGHRLKARRYVLVARAADSTNHHAARKRVKFKIKH